MKLNFSTLLLGTAASAALINTNTTTLHPRQIPGEIPSKYDGMTPYSVGMPPIKIMTFGTSDCSGGAQTQAKTVYGANVRRQNLRSIHLSRDLLNMESLTFATKPTHARRGSATIEDRGTKGTPQDCMNIIETAPTPLSGLPGPMVDPVNGGGMLSSLFSSVFE